MNFNSLGLKKLIATCYAASQVMYTQLDFFDSQGEPGQDRIENDSIDLILKPVVWLNLYKNASLQLSQWVQSNISSLTDRAKAFWADISVFDVLSSKKTTENASGGVIQRDIDR